MGCTPNGQEEKLTARSVRNKLLPQIQQLREALEIDLRSLRYLVGSTHGGIEESQLDMIRMGLATAENRLRLFGGV